MNRMFSDPIDTVDYIVMNTDAQALELATVPTGLRVGDTTARVWVLAAIPRRGAFATRRTAKRSRRYWKALTWFLSPPGWAEALALAALPS